MSITVNIPEELYEKAAEIADAQDDIGRLTGLYTQVDRREAGLKPGRGLRGCLLSRSGIQGRL